MSDHIGSLNHDPRNARRHSPRNVGMLVDALQSVGAARSIVIDEDGTILAGNATVEAAAQAGIERLRIVDADGEEIIAVRRSGLTPEQKTALALYDNRVAELADWDADVLAGLAAEVDLSGMWRDDELTALLAGVTTEPVADPGPQVDKADELREKWSTALGQLWEIPSLSVAGKAHRLLCGDSTNADDVSRLMAGERADMVFADPPFGIGYTGHGKSKEGRANKFKAIDGDDVPNADWLQYCLPLSDGALYIKTTWAVLRAWEDSLSQVAAIRSHIVWDKCSHVGGDIVGGYATRSEILLFASIGRHIISKFDTDVWSIPRATIGAPEERTGHPYEFPVGLSLRAIENSTTVSGLILDPFVGSGTTIVAAEQAARRCNGLELSPSFLAVALERLAGCGLTPQRLD